ncbi:MAG: ferritin-like domain-containing protein, partial [Ilumatobacteraceae bacterium]
RDELRRELRDIAAEQRRAEADQATLGEVVLEHVPEGQRGSLFLPSLDRRTLLRAGSIGVLATTLLAACREAKPKINLPVSGDNPGYQAPPNKTITDVTLLRTAASFADSVVEAYRRLADNEFTSDQAVLDLMKLFSDHHSAHAVALGKVTTDLGGTACVGVNQKITSYLIDPLLTRISKSGAEQEEDVKAFAFAMETIAAATYQAVVPSFTTPALRKAAMSVGAVESRHAAVLGMLINPSAIITGVVAAPTEAPADTTTTTIDAGLPTTAPAQTTTTIQAAYQANEIHAIPSRFGSLAPFPLTVGPANENGVRVTTNVETPSLNSFIYDDDAC